MVESPSMIASCGCVLGRGALAVVVSDSRKSRILAWQASGRVSFTAQVQAMLEGGGEIAATSATMSVASASA